jgi:hypothetical protein
MRIRVTLEDDLRQMLAEEYSLLEVASTRAMRRAGEGLKTELRGQVRQAGLGNRLANTWRAQSFPQAGFSAGAAALVFSKAPQIARAFDEGATIRSKAGFWLAIPSDAAPKRGTGGKRLSPSNFPEHIYGRLRFVYRTKGPSMLVVDNQRERRGKRTRGTPFTLSKSKRALRTGTGLATVPMFFLFPQVKLRKRLDVAPVAARWRDRIGALIDAEFGRAERLLA